MDKKNKLPKGITQEQVDAWKQEHGDVYIIEVEAKGKVKDAAYAVLKPANRNTIGFAMARKQDGDTDGAGELILRNCWLAGTSFLKEPKGNDEELMAFSACLSAFGTIDIPVSTIKKN